MNVKETLSQLGGCAGGRAVYYSVKALQGIRNKTRQDRVLKPETIKRLQPLFPDLDLRDITFNINAFVPADWYVDNAWGMTFGRHLIFNHSGIQRTKTGLEHLMHELVHVDQVRRFGWSESKFACEYGKGYVDAGNDYAANRFEREAFDFVRDNPVPPPATHTGLVFYSQNRGTGALYKVNKDAALEKVRAHEGDWSTTWDQIVPGMFGRDFWEDLLFYDKEAGTARFESINDGDLKALRVHHNSWRTTWDLIVAGEFGDNGHTDLLMYDRDLGFAQLYTTSSYNNRQLTSMGLLRTFDSWRKTWDMIVPGEWGRDGFTDLHFYDREAGDSALYLSDGQGSLYFLERHDNLRTSWDIIASADLGRGERSDLLFYDRSTGDLEFYRVDKDGGLELMNKGEGARDWDLIVPGQFGGEGPGDDLLFYSRERGTGEFYTFDANADGLGVIEKYNNKWRKDWDQIVPLTFA